MASNQRNVNEQEDNLMNGKDPPDAFYESRCSICLQILENHGLILKTNFQHCDSCSLKCCEDCAFIKSDIEWLCPNARNLGPVEKRLAKLDHDSYLRTKEKNKENIRRNKKSLEEQNRTTLVITEPIDSTSTRPNTIENHKASHSRRRAACKRFGFSPKLHETHSLSIPPPRIAPNTSEPKPSSNLKPAGLPSDQKPSVTFADNLIEEIRFKDEDFNHSTESEIGLESFAEKSHCNVQGITHTAESAISLDRVECQDQYATREADEEVNSDTVESYCKVKGVTHLAESAIYLDTVESHCEDKGATQTPETELDGDTGELHYKVQEVTHKSEPLVGVHTVKSHCQKEGASRTEIECDLRELHCKVQGATYTSESITESESVTSHCEIQGATSTSQSATEYDKVISVHGVTNTAVCFDSSSSASHYKLQAVTRSAVSIDSDSATSHSNTQVDAEVICRGVTSSETMEKSNNFGRPADSNFPESPRENRSSANMRPNNNSDRQAAPNVPQSPRDNRSSESMQINNRCDRPAASIFPQNPRENRSSGNTTQNNNSDRQVASSVPQSLRENRSSGYIKQNNNSDRQAASNVSQSPKDNRSSESMQINNRCDNRPAASRLPQNPRGNKSSGNMTHNNNSDRQAASSVPQSPRDDWSSESMQENNRVLQRRREDRPLDNLHDEENSFRSLSPSYLEGYFSQRSGMFQSADLVPNQGTTSADGCNMRKAIGETSSGREDNRRSHSVSQNDNHRPRRLSIPCHFFEGGPLSTRPKLPHYPRYSVDSREYDASQRNERRSRRRSRLHRQRALFNENGGTDATGYDDYNYNAPPNSTDEDIQIHLRRMHEAKIVEQRNRRQRNLDEREVREMLAIRNRARGRRSSVNPQCFWGPSCITCAGESFDIDLTTGELYVNCQDTGPIDEQELMPIDREDPTSVNRRRDPAIIGRQESRSLCSRQDLRSTDRQIPRSINREDLRMHSRSSDIPIFPKNDSKGERHELKRQSRVTDSPKKQGIEKQEREQGTQPKVKSDQEQDMDDRKEGTRPKVKNTPMNNDQQHRDVRPKVKDTEHHNTNAQEKGARPKDNTSQMQNTEVREKGARPKDVTRHIHNTDEIEKGARPKDKASDMQNTDKKEKGARAKYKASHMQNADEKEKGAREKDNASHMQNKDEKEKGAREKDNASHMQNADEKEKGARAKDNASQMQNKDEKEKGARPKDKTSHMQNTYENKTGARPKVKTNYLQNTDETEKGARPNVRSGHRSDIEEQEKEERERSKSKGAHKNDIETPDQEGRGRSKTRNGHKRDSEKQDKQERSKSRCGDKEDIEDQEKQKRERCKKKYGHTQTARSFEEPESPRGSYERYYGEEASEGASGGQTYTGRSSNDDRETQDAPRHDNEGDEHTTHMTVQFHNSAYSRDCLGNPTDAYEAETLPRYHYMGEMEQAGAAAYVPAYSTWYRGRGPRTNRAAVREVTGYARSMDVTDTYERYSYSETRSLYIATEKDMSEDLPRMPLQPVRKIIKKAEKVKLLRQEYADVSFEQAYESGSRRLPARRNEVGTHPVIRISNSDGKEVAKKSDNNPRAAREQRLKYSICFVLIGAYGQKRSTNADSLIIPQAFAIGCIPPFDKNDAHATIVIESSETLWNSRWSLPLPAEALNTYLIEICVWDARLHIVPRLLRGRTTVTIHFEGLTDQIRWLPLVLSFNDRMIQSGNSVPAIAMVNGNFIGLHMSELEVRLQLRLQEANVLLPRPLTDRRRRNTNCRAVRFADDPNRSSKDDKNNKDDKDEDTGNKKKFGDFCKTQ